MDRKKNFEAQAAAFHEYAIRCGTIPGMEWVANVLSLEAKRLDDEIAELNEDGDSQTGQEYNVR